MLEWLLENNIVVVVVDEIRICIRPTYLSNMTDFTSAEMLKWVSHCCLTPRDKLIMTRENTIRWDDGDIHLALDEHA
jgi:hypothetical protein